MKDAVIELVFNKPAIWDKQHKQHRNRHFLVKEWKKVATALNSTEREVRNCWKNLRQEFSKQLKRVDNDIDSQWHYFEKLHFLRGQFEFASRDSSSNFLETSFHSDEEDPLFDLDYKTSPAATPSTSSSRPTSRSEYSNFAKIALKKRPTSENLDEEKEKHVLKRCKLCEVHSDEDTGFFNSLLPHVKKLSPKDKLIFRMKVQETLFELSYPQEQTTNAF